MFKSLVVLAIAGTMSVPAAAQSTQSAPVANDTQAKPQMIKKKVCADEDNAFSRVKTRTCKTVLVPAQPTNGRQAPAQGQEPNKG
jgi:hypothetical protein